MKLVLDMDRLFRRVEKTDGCWLWRGWVNVDGYGLTHFKREGEKRTTAAVHRVVYESLVGPIPDGLTLDHLCRVRNCVNPDHLEPVARGENTVRGMAGAYQARPQLEAALRAIAHYPFDVNSDAVSDLHAVKLIASESLGHLSERSVA